MKPSSHHKNINKEKGATIVLVAILLVVIVGIAGLAIDIGNLTATKGELQKLADGAALAGAGNLGIQYLTGGSCGSIDQNDIWLSANGVAGQNMADAKSVSLQGSDVALGCWDFDNDEDPWDALDEGDCGCDPGERRPNAVQVTAHRDSEYNKPVDTFFAGIFGQDTVGLMADAVAALSGPSEVSDLPIPVGISKAWFDEDKWAAEGKDFCGQPIKFYPTGSGPLEGCAGWHVYGSETDPPEVCEGGWSDYIGWPSNANKLSNLLLKLALPESDPDYCPPPGGSAGDPYTYTGGNVASAFPEMKVLFDAKKAYDPDYPAFPDGVWKVAVPVYDSDSCQPNTIIPTAGYTTAIITEVFESPTHTINAIVVCNEINPGHGGGGEFGSLSSIPGLVE